MHTNTSKATTKNTAFILDEIDRHIIVATQSGLPMTSRPYQFIAQQLALTEDEVIKRVQHLHDTGIIRRIGAIPNHYKLGYHANGMSVWNIPDDMVTLLGEQVGALPFVSHCYHRPRCLPEWPYNLFAMVHAKSRDEAMQLVTQIKQVLGDYCRGHDVLFSTKILKKTGSRLPARE